MIPDLTKATIQFKKVDMSDYTVSDDYALYDGMSNKENDKDLDPEISHALIDIEYFMGSAQKYVVNDWVLVQFCTKKSIKHFVRQIILDNGETPTIKYVRKVRTAKKESIFVYPRNDDICELKHVEDILAVLPAPEISRRGHVIFKINFSNN